MKILWSSNMPWTSSGYSNQTRLFVPRLQAMGHQVTIMSNYGLQGASVQLDANTLALPPGYDTYGNDILPAHAECCKADIVITLYDAWVFAPDTMRRFKWCPWLPCDTYPLSPRVAKALIPAWQPIVFTHYGEKMLTEAGFHPLYVPHGVDTKAYCPGDKAAARQELGIAPDIFMASMVAANKGTPSRKAFPEVFAAWKGFTDDHPDAMLYLHTHMGPETAGLDLCALALGVGIKEGNLKWCDQYRYVLGFETEYMRAIYQASDVLLSPSMGEGFGIPIIEAQACGCPVIVGDWTAMPELCFAGYKVTGQQFWQPGYEAWQYVPNIDSIRDALEKTYKDRAFLGTGRRAREGAEAYDADRVTEQYWRPALERIERSLHNSGQVVEEVGGHVHKWAATGLYNKAGDLCFPCCDPRCEAERRLTRTGQEMISETGFGLTISGLPLDIEDDPQGGVAKIICREAIQNYRLDDIPFVAGDVALDIGAHVGIISIYLAKKHPDIRIIAYEPGPDNYKRLLRNLKANGVENVEAVNAAVSGDGGNFTLRGSPEMNSGGLSGYTTGRIIASAPLLAVRLATIFAEHKIDRLTLLKIDCEGAEHEILTVGESLLDRVDYLTGEFHDNARLAAAGYTSALLRALCERHIAPGRVQVHSQRISA